MDKGGDKIPLAIHGFHQGDLRSGSNKIVFRIVGVVVHVSVDVVGKHSHRHDLGDCTARFWQQALFVVGKEGSSLGIIATDKGTEHIKVEGYLGYIFFVLGGGVGGGANHVASVKEHGTWHNGI